MAAREAAASRLCAAARGRRDRRLCRLHRLGHRVTNQYKQNLTVGPEASESLFYGAVMRLDGRLLKQSGLSWQPRAVRVSTEAGLQFKYASKQG